MSPSTARAQPALSRLLLGPDPAQQVRAWHTLLALGAYASFAAVLHLEQRLGLLSAAQSWPPVAFGVGGGLGFYLLIRSGLNLRLVPRGDRALTLPQQLWAVASMAWAYAVTGPARGAVLLVLALILVYGVFTLDPRRVRVLAATAFALLSGVMGWQTWTDPARYDPRVEGMHLLFAAIVIAGVSALAERLGTLRARLESQRRDLQLALARIQRLATHDELTGLKNRRAALDHLRGLLAARATGAPPLCLALIDLDHFKRINDTLGHAAGDAVLRRFAECGTAGLRSDDTLARWGGEEFLLVLPATGPDVALALLAAMRRRLHGACLSDLTRGPGLSFSAGVAECHGLQDLEAALERADAAMYRAKQAGRDRALAAPAVDAVTA